MLSEQPEPRHDARALVEREIAAALTCERGNRRADAVTHYQNAMQLARQDAAVFSDAIKHVSSACRQAPRDAALRHLLGAAYLFAKDLPNAETQLRKAAALAPRVAQVQRTLGDCFMKGGKANEALAAYRKANALAPQDTETRLRLAGLLVYLGERAEARGLYQRLIDEGVRNPLAYSGLIEVSDYSTDAPEPPEYSAALSLAEDPALPPALRRMLHFSAAKIDRVRMRRDREFAHYLRGKEYFSYRFDLTYFSELTAALKEAITPEFYFERAAYSDKSKRPVFIFGMPRSGTTLAEQILAAHPSVAAAGELTFFTAAARQLGLAPRRSEESLPLERVAERLRSLDLPSVKGLAGKYSEQLQWRGAGKIRVTDKMPGNFLHLWLIALMFRDAVYIHCVRDSLATCFSCFTTDLGDAHAYTRDFPTLAGYYRLYEDLMRHWAKVLPIRIFENRYEDLVRAPEPSVRELLAAAGLPWDPACLSFHESHRLAQTASYAAVREPIHPRNLEKWRAYESYLEPLKDALGTAANDRSRPAG